MSQKEKINYYPFVELPDPKIRYLIRNSEKEPIAVLWFGDDGTPKIRYLKPVPPELEIPILDFMNDKQRLLFGR
jgi:hypothetical protein